MEQAEFGEYAWDSTYKFDLVFLCHAVGYLEDKPLVRFLRRAGDKLRNTPPARTTRQALRQHGACICILDNLRQDGKRAIVDDQRIRSEDEMMQLFSQAGLSVVLASRATEVHPAYLPVKVWLLA